MAWTSPPGMNTHSPALRSCLTRSSSKEPSATAFSTSREETPSLSPAHTKPSSSMHHISVFGLPPVAGAVASFGCTCTERRVFASISLTRSGKPGTISPSLLPANFPPATTLSPAGCAERSHLSRPHRASWTLSPNTRTLSLRSIFSLSCMSGRETAPPPTECRAP